MKTERWCPQQNTVKWVSVDEVREPESDREIERKREEVVYVAEE